MTGFEINTPQMRVKIMDPVEGNNVKSLGNLVGYVSQIMLTQLICWRNLCNLRRFSAHSLLSP